jgi:hypothetical protein
MPNGTAVYRKSTHTGQYVHLSSFTPWCRKIAWLRALVYRAYKICSNDELLRNELSNITKFASWNGFSKQLTNKEQNNRHSENTINYFRSVYCFVLFKITQCMATVITINKPLESFSPKLPNNLSNDEVVTVYTDPPTNPPTIWIHDHLPFIGKRGSSLIYHCTKKIDSFLKQCNLLNTSPYGTPLMQMSSLVLKIPRQNNTKVPLSTNLLQSRLLTFLYVGKTDRCLITRLKPDDG